MRAVVKEGTVNMPGPMGKMPDFRMEFRKKTGNICVISVKKTDMPGPGFYRFPIKGLVLFYAPSWLKRTAEIGIIKNDIWLRHMI